MNVETIERDRSRFHIVYTRTLTIGRCIMMINHYLMNTIKVADGTGDVYDHPAATGGRHLQKSHV